VNTTVDRLVADTVPLREVADTLLDPHQTGYRITELGALISPSITSDSHEPVFMLAGQQLVGSFLPAISVHWLADFLELDSAIHPSSGDDGDLMVLPPPHWQRMRLRIRGVFDGVPSLIAFED
jgi:hypothetical protein